MGLRVGLCLCLVLVFAVLCDGRYTISGSGMFSFLLFLFWKCKFVKIFLGKLDSQ